jgi:nucleotide-binding universal stress UspA family protein
MPVIGDRPDLNLDTVVYATDFSLCSQNAGIYAARFASRFSARLLVAHAFTLTQAALEVETDKSKQSVQRKDLMSLLSETASLLTSETVSASPVLLEGDPKQVIPALADLHAPSLLVLGTHGGGRLARGLIGSVAEQVLRSTSWPVLTVGPRAKPVSAATFPFRRILFATDFSASAAQAASFAVFMAETLTASIDVLNVIQEDTLLHTGKLSDRKDHFFHALDNLVPQHAREFCDPKTFVAVGEAHDQILEHVRARSIDLLVLGIRKTSYLSMEMRTSGAFRLIVDAECPVLTVRS